jgi:hypothetical protein
MKRPDQGYSDIPPRPGGSAALPSAGDGDEQLFDPGVVRDGTDSTRCWPASYATVSIIAFSH